MLSITIVKAAGPLVLYVKMLICLQKEHNAEFGMLNFISFMTTCICFFKSISFPCRATTVVKVFEALRCPPLDVSARFETLQQVKEVANRSKEARTKDLCSLVDREVDLLKRSVVYRVPTVICRILILQAGTWPKRHADFEYVWNFQGASSGFVYVDEERSHS